MPSCGSLHKEDSWGLAHSIHHIVFPADVHVYGGRSCWLFLTFPYNGSVEDKYACVPVTECGIGSGL